MEVEQETTKKKVVKEIIKVKDEESVEEKDIKIEEELLGFKDKPWTNLRKKIVEKQVRKEPVQRPDMRTPYQKCTEEPVGPGMCPLEINSHIRLSLQEIDEFLGSRPFNSSSFLPLAPSRRLMEPYKTDVNPDFGINPELGTQLEGLLSGVAFSGVSKKAAQVSSVELEKLSLTTFNIIEIVSFLMAAIAVMAEGLEAATEKSKGPAMVLLKEYRPFLGSIDKACRHLTKETLAMLATFMTKQRSIWASCVSYMVPRPLKAKMMRAPLATFEVAPMEVMRNVKTQFDTFLQGKAFATAVANVGANRAKVFNKVVKKKVAERGRGMKVRGQGFRGAAVGRGSRGFNRGPLRGVRKASLSWRNQRAFERRDRFVNKEGVPGTSTAPPLFAGTPGGSGENRQ